MRRYLVILTCLALAGCTKTESPAAESRPEAPAPPAARRPAAPDTRKVIAVLGDSLAEGLGVPPGKSYPDVVQQTLDRKGYSYRVVNLGVSGDTTTGALSRLSYALSLKPSILVIELGGNDGLRGVPVPSTKANLEKMIVTAQKSGADVLLAGMTLPPNYGADYIRKFEAVYHDLARKYRVQLIPSLMRPIAEQIESRPGLMQGDGIHPTVEGHEILADTVVRYLMPMLHRS